MKFRIKYTLDVTLDIDQIWPDQDAPSVPDERDVIQAMCRSLRPHGAGRQWIDDDDARRIIDDWDLGPGEFIVERVDEVKR